MPRRRFHWRHPFSHLHLLDDAIARMPIRIEVEFKPPVNRSRKRAVYEYRLRVAGVDFGTFRTFDAAEKAIPDECVRAVA